MAKRQDPAEHQREREELRREIEDTQPEDISLGMMPLGPEDVRSIFGALKVFRTRHPELAESVLARVGKMLKATPEEMEAGLKTRARNDWKPNLKPQGSGGTLADAGSKVDRPVDVGRALRRALPEDIKAQPPQGPNEARASKAAVKATEKIITRVEAAIKNAKQ
jgi:hypothetical protein